VDPDPGDRKRTKKEGKNASKRQIIRHEKDKEQYTGNGSVNWYKMGTVPVNVTGTLFSLKVNIKLVF
jgi:hypothetical protein